MKSILDKVCNQDNWDNWIDSSGKSDPPPDFYSDEYKIMMDVMRVNDHEHKGKKGKLYNPSIAHERQMFKELEQSGILNQFPNARVFLNGDTQLSTHEDHNYNLYLKCFQRVISKHIDSIPLYKENHPGYKVIFLVFDVNLRQGFYNKEILCKSMQNCNILKINDEELITVSRMFGYPGIDLQDKCWILLGKYNLKMLILTCGINGSYVFTPGNVSFQPTPKVEVADTVGAGDSFTAAFIASILKGKSVTEAHSIAVKTSAYVCTQKGAMPILPPEYTA